MSLRESLLTGLFVIFVVFAVLVVLLVLIKVFTSVIAGLSSGKTDGAQIDSRERG